MWTLLRCENHSRTDSSYKYFLHCGDLHEGKKQANEWNSCLVAKLTTNLRKSWPFNHLQGTGKILRGKVPNTQTTWWPSFPAQNDHTAATWFIFSKPCGASHRRQRNYRLRTRNLPRCETHCNPPKIVLLQPLYNVKLKILWVACCKHKTLSKPKRVHQKLRSSTITPLQPDSFLSHAPAELRRDTERERIKKRERCETHYKHPKMVDFKPLYNLKLKTLWVKFSIHRGAGIHEVYVLSCIFSTLPRSHA